MNWEILLIILLAVTTLLVCFLRLLCKNKSNTFAKFVNKIWDEWFEEQWHAIIALILFVIVTIVLALIFKN